MYRKLGKVPKFLKINLDIELSAIHEKAHKELEKAANCRESYSDCKNSLRKVYKLHYIYIYKAPKCFKTDLNGKH